MTQYYESLTAPCTTSVLVDTSASIGDLYFGITLTAEPVTGLTFCVLVTHGLKNKTIPQSKIDLLLSALHDEIRGGGKFGFPIKNVHFTVSAVDYRESTSTEPAIRMAVSKLIQNLLTTASFVTIDDRT